MLQRASQFVRFTYINYILAKHGIDRVVLSAPPLKGVRFIRHLNPWNWFRKNDQQHGESLRLAFEALGPIFVKFGQLLSTRRDIIPDDLANELAKLQDRVPPFPGEIARKLVEKAYGRPVTEVFASFEVEPMASASIAQVHAATLIDGSQVVVKVLRPEIKRTIRRDIGLMYFVAAIAERFWAHGERLKPRAVVAEFEKTLTDELDMMREAANASQLRRNFEHSDLLYIPKVYWDYTTHRVLVIERIIGIPVGDIPSLKRHGIDLKQLAENGVDIFFRQVFEHSFFHADMHPGNIFVSTENKTNPKYLAVDFGIVGSLGPVDQRYLAENLLAFFRRDYRQVAVLHVESGWVSADTRIEEFESAIRAVCEPIFERPLKDISFGNLLLRLFQTAGRFNMEVQPQLLLLQKTLLSIEGLGRLLYPDLNLWVTAKPFLECWMKEKIGVLALAKNVANKAPYWAEKMTDLPDLIYKALQQTASQPKSLAPPAVGLTKREGIGHRRLLLVSALMLTTAATLNLWFASGSADLRHGLQYVLYAVSGLLVVLSAF